MVVYLRINHDGNLDIDQRKWFEVIGFEFEQVGSNGFREKVNEAE